MTSVDSIPPAIYVGNFGLGGCPFLFGLLKQMNEKWGNEFYKKTKWYCDSFSVVFIIQLLCGHEIERIRRGYNSIMKKMCQNPMYLHGQTVWLDLYVQYLLKNEKDLLESIVNLFIGITIPYTQHVWFHSWKTTEELMLHIKASYNIPLYSDHCGKIDGEEVFNGAYSCTPEDLLLIHENILKISASPSLTDIPCRLSVYDIYHINNHESLYSYFYLMGYESFNDRKIENNRNLLENETKRKNQVNIPMLVVCWIGKGMQIAYEYIVREIIEK